MLKGLETLGNVLIGLKTTDELVKGVDNHKYSGIMQKFKHSLQRKEIHPWGYPLQGQNELTDVYKELKLVGYTATVDHASRFGS